MSMTLEELAQGLDELAAALQFKGYARAETSLFYGQSSKFWIATARYYIRDKGIEVYFNSNVDPYVLWTRLNAAVTNAPTLLTDEQMSTAVAPWFDVDQAESETTTPAR